MVTVYLQSQHQHHSVSDGIFKTHTPQTGLLQSSFALNELGITRGTGIRQGAIMAPLVPRAAFMYQPYSFLLIVLILLDTKPTLGLRMAPALLNLTDSSGVTQGSLVVPTSFNQSGSLIATQTSLMNHSRCYCWCWCYCWCY